MQTAPDRPSALRSEIATLADARDSEAQLIASVRDAVESQIDADADRRTVRDQRLRDALRDALRRALRRASLRPERGRERRALGLALRRASLLAPRPCSVTLPLATAPAGATRGKRATPPAGATARAGATHGSWDEACEARGGCLRYRDRLCVLLADA